MYAISEIAVPGSSAQLTREGLTNLAHCRYTPIPVKRINSNHNVNAA